MSELILDRRPLESLTTAVGTVRSLVRPPQDVYFQELQNSYRRISVFLPTLVKYIHFDSSQAGKSVVLAWDWIRDNITLSKPGQDAPMGIVNADWRPYVSPKDNTFNFRAYIFCTLDRLRTVLKRREVFVTPSWHYADPRAPLLKGAEWEIVRPVICRTLGLSPDPKPILTARTTEPPCVRKDVASRYNAGLLGTSHGTDSKSSQIRSI